MKIALLGCTGQIGRGFVRSLAGAHELKLYARRADFMRGWLARRGISASVHELAEFPSGAFDLIINAIGYGVPGKIRAAGPAMLEITEHFDRLCLDHLRRGTSGSCIFLSTGRVYGEAYEGAQGPQPRPLPPEAFRQDESYALAKRRAELRHREAAPTPIADIRIFGYVSEEIGLDDDFLVSQMLRALVDGAVFETAPHDIVRDYVGREDLSQLTERLLAVGVPNAAYDIVSARPTTKFEMVQALAAAHGLRYSVAGEGAPILSDRPVTISRDRTACSIGHVPQRTSLENVLATAAAVTGTRDHDMRRYAQ